MQFGRKTPCHACVDDIIHAEMVNHCLCADCGVDFADTAFHQYHIIPFVTSHIISQTNHAFGGNDIHFFPQERNFFFHSTNDADCSHVYPLLF